MKQLAPLWQFAPNSLAHGWEILEAYATTSKCNAEAIRDRIQGGRGCGFEVKIGETSVKKFGARIDLWVVVKRRKLQKGEA